MNAGQTRWSCRYQAALRQHLKQGPASSLQPALRLGRQATTLGLETLDIARIHEGALAALKPSAGREAIPGRAETFFAETVTPIEETHRAALKANRRVRKATAVLVRRTTGLVTARQQLKTRVAQRKSAEKALKKSGEHYAKLLQESRDLQEHLRRLAHQILSAREHERARVSRELHDDIAQTLLGIHVRLLTLRMGAATNARGLKKEVASTQRLVGKSASLMARYTHELGSRHET